MKKSLVKPKSGVIAALDVGSTKICCLIARVEDFRKPKPDASLSNIRVLGVGHNIAEGIRNGAIIDMESCELSIRRAVQSAETAHTASEKGGRSPR